MDLGLLSLGDALSDPDDVAVLLLLKFDVGVKYPKVELLQESEYVQLDLGRNRTEGLDISKTERIRSEVNFKIDIVILREKTISGYFLN